MELENAWWFHYTSPSFHNRASTKKIAIVPLARVVDLKIVPASDMKYAYSSVLSKQMLH